METIRIYFILSLLVLSGTVVGQTPTVSGDNILCPQGTGTLATQTYDTYQWYRRYYGSTVTNPIPGETNQDLQMDYFAYAASYMSVEVTSGASTYISAEYFVDGWIFAPPVVMSLGDFTIGTSGQSIICPGDTMYFQFSDPYDTNIKWYKDGSPIAGENTQVLAVTESGIYYVDGAPSVCPDYIQGPGVTLVVEQLSFPSPIITPNGPYSIGVDGEYIICTGEVISFELNDPFDTNISWYQNGTILTGESNQVLSVSDSGTYTVMSAPAACPDYIKDAGISLVVEFCDLGILDQKQDFIITTYPNPTTSELFVTIPAEKIGSSYQIVDMTGKIILKGTLTDSNMILNLMEFNEGAYLLFVDEQCGRVINVVRN
jgi:hypothetical protein